MELDEFLFLLIFGIIPTIFYLKMVKRTKSPRKRRDDLLDDDFED